MIIDLLTLMFRLLIVGCLQTNGAYQVGALIAFAHFGVHLFVVVVFLVQLVYGVVITIRSIVKAKRSLDLTGSNLKKHTSYDSFAAAFDYQHVLQKKKMPAVDEDVNSGSVNDSVSEVLYYRSGTIFEARSDDLDSIALLRSIIFKGTSEEADLIYRKYFTGDLVDPDIKAMWDARQIWDTQELRNNKEIMEKIQSPQTNNGPAGRLCNLFGKKQPVERSFHVSRPRKLIVKKLEDDGNSLLTSDSTSTK